MRDDKKFSGTMWIDLTSDVPPYPAHGKRPPPVVLKHAVRPTAHESRRLRIIRKDSKPSSARFDELLESIYDAVLITDNAGSIRNANGRALQFFQFTAEEIATVSIVTLLEGADSSLLQTLATNLKNDRYTFILANCRRKDGTMFPGEIAVNPLHTEGDELCFFIRDITTRRQAEDLLRAENYALQNAANGIAISDSDLVFEYVNPAFARLFEYTPPETLYGVGLRQVLDASDMISDMATAVLERGASWSGEFNTVTASGKKLDFEMVATCNRNADGEPVGIIFSLTDLSDRKRADSAVREQQRLEMLSRVVEGTIRAMSLAVESRDPYTAGHEQNVADLAVEIAKELEVDEFEQKGIYYAGLVHDLGKISIPAELLSAPGWLCDEAMSLIRKHPFTGYNILKNVEFPWPVAEMVYQHHERLDGSGYPRGLAGDAVIYQARILAVADAVDAMASHRPYRASLGLEHALEEIEKNRGTHYDPTVVDACLKVFRVNGYEIKVPVRSFLETTGIES